MPPTSLLVLAGGFGTRLRTAVSAVPKPLAPVVGRPYLHYLIENWVEQGVTSLTFLVHHQADLIEAFLELRQSTGDGPMICNVRTLREPRPLGTGGALAYAVQQLQITGSFLATNADTWLGSGIRQVTGAGVPAMAVVRVENSERYGSVRIERNTVTGFEEKQNSAGAGWINAGLYHLHAAQFQDWNSQPFSLERELFPVLVNTRQLKAIPLETEFIDIGVPEDYFRFCRWIESGKSSVL
jgi:D-glycero-alpha-D-manno-heptose 1-phosphate guanylyltransferase